MDFKQMFLGDRDTMTIFRQKGKIGLVLLLLAVAALVALPLLAAALTALEYLRFGVFTPAVLLEMLEPLRLWFYVLPYALIAIGFLVRKKIIAVIGAVLALISALLDAIISVLWISYVLFSHVMTMLPRLGELPVGQVIAWIFWRLVNLLNACVPLIGVLAAAVLLWMLLTAEGKRKSGAIAAIVVQILQLATLVLVVACALIASVSALATNLLSGSFVLMDLIAYLPPFLEVFPSILLCPALLLFAIGILRFKKEAADAPIEGEAVEISEIAEEATEEAAPTAGEESAEEAVPAAEA